MWAGSRCLGSVLFQLPRPVKRLPSSCRLRTEETEAQRGPHPLRPPALCPVGEGRPASLPGDGCSAAGAGGSAELGLSPPRPSLGCSSRAPGRPCLIGLVFYCETLVGLHLGGGGRHTPLQQPGSGFEVRRTLDCFSICRSPGICPRKERQLRSRSPQPPLQASPAGPGSGHTPAGFPFPPTPSPGDTAGVPCVNRG